MTDPATAKHDHRQPRPAPIARFPFIRITSFVLLSHRTRAWNVRVSPLAAVLVALLTLLASGCTGRGSLQRHEFTRLCMGVQARIVLFAENSQTASSAAALTFHRLAELDGCMSDYRPASELMQLCRNAGQPPTPVSQDLFDILSEAIQISRATDGAFDPTIGPCVALWRAARHSGLPPSPDELQAARALVNWRLLELDGSARTARLAEPGMKLDLGGIAKGFAADRGVRFLRTQGIDRCLVALAGDIAVGDPPPGKGGWSIEVPGLPAPLILRNCAVSTSGDAEQAFESEGRHFSHIIDPRTGVGAPYRRQATAVAPKGEWADALSTAAYLLGPTETPSLERAFPGTRFTIIAH